MEIRRLKFGANVIAFTVVVLIFWAMVNYLNSRHHHRFDLTSNRQYSLSAKTIVILKDLKEPVYITTLYRPGTLIFRQVKDILEEYSGKSRNITVEHIDAERDRGKVELLAKRLNMDTFELNTVIFECGEKSKHVPESEVIEYDFSPYQRREPAPPKFKGEEAFTSAILAVTQEKQSMLYFVSGHGEKDIGGFAKLGISDAAKLLKRQNFKVEKLLLFGEEKIPDDCDVLNIIGPTKSFSSHEIETLREYLASGGKCLIMIDPLVDCGLEGFLSEWGVKIGGDVVLDPVRRLFFTGPTTIFTDDYGYHKITQKMKGIATIFSLARSVEFFSKEAFQGTELVRTSEEAWAETNVKAREAKYDEGEDKKGPISLGAAVGEKKIPSLPGGNLPGGSQEQVDYDEEETHGSRLVVFGDSDFVSNAQVANAGNSDLFLNSINWLAEKEKLISIGPKSPDIRKVSLSGKQMQAIFWGTIAGLPLLAVFIGVFVWLKRRR